ncbi:hypothetical protein CSQ96_18820 [Janthinobacterium sp. BJB412]|nr:hypothetical protein CSQ96_18820 [Janthinobacterium sp. BJB412]
MVGSGRLVSTGACKELSDELTGSGDLYARHLASDKLRVHLKGSGTTQVLARRAADLELRGSGDIRVYGTPDQRSVSRGGSGEVSWDR